MALTDTFAKNVKVGELVTVKNTPMGKGCFCTSSRPASSGE